VIVLETVLAREIVMPRLSDSMEEGTILKWLVAEGDELREGQPLVEVETDKAVVTHEADGPATVLALLVGEGASVAVGSPILVVGAAGEALPEQSSPEALAAVGQAEAGASPTSTPAAAASFSTTAVAQAPLPASRVPAPAGPAGGRVKASPLARRIAAELHVDLSALTGSGLSGRVIRSDVERAAGAEAGAGGGAAAGVGNGNGDGDGDGSAATPARAAQAAGAKGETSRHELTTIQRTVARRMAESRATVPDIELRAEVDMTAAVALREQLRALPDLTLPSLNDLIVKAAAIALREFPRVNGAYRDAAFETYGRVNIGIAVAGEGSLVVPTVFDADVKSLREIAQTTRTLAVSVRDGSISPADLAGGTFSISNLGMFGIDSFSAVINPPQAAILAVGALRRRPVVLGDSGEIVARETVQLTLACDHRIVYGVDGARFMVRLRELLEQPLSLLV
jgi:pyruvate dehydrogenase E2 component (dihydrolipoamide acetyltransferase)